MCRGAAGKLHGEGFPLAGARNLIKDLLEFYQPATVFDPMTGSGTFRDVREELAIDCVSTDLKFGFDATDPAAYAQYARQTSNDFV